ncbi:hypothetical protein [Nocardia sp. NPDC057030]|uniref:hypothetical protein n=1 Tax=unclassified Nocardia TaxID=2637762 RepID=UPI0036409F01
MRTPVLPIYHCDEDIPSIASYDQAQAIALAHSRILNHSPGCKADLAAVAYLSAGLDDEE